MSGKGSKRRPTNEAAYQAQYERIFGQATRSPVPHSPMAEAQGDAPGEGAAVPVLPTVGQDHGSDGR